MFVCYPAIATILFVCLGWSFAIIFKSLRSEVDTLKASAFFEPRDIRARLEQWRRNVILFDDLLDHFNQCFGLILFFYVSKTFLQSAATCFSFVDFLKTERLEAFAIFLLNFAVGMIHFALTICVPQKIRDEVVEFTQQLRRLHFEDTALQHQVEMN